MLVKKKLGAIAYALSVVFAICFFGVVNRVQADGGNTKVTVIGTVTTSPIAGVTITTSPTGTATVVGTVTTTPLAGATFIVGGTVTPAPAGTQTTFVANTVTVQGTITPAPAGTQTVLAVGTVTTSPAPGVTDTPGPLPDSTVTGTISGSGVLGPIAVGGYNTVSFTIPVGSWSAGNITAQYSVDGGLTYLTSAYCPLPVGSSSTASLTSGVLTFGTRTGFAVLGPGATHFQLTASSITGTTGTATLKACVTNGFYSQLILAGGVNANTAICTTGGTILVGGSGAGGSSTLRVLQGGAVATHMSTNTTTTCKGSAGTLHAIVINTRGVGNTATVYDNTAGSGTVIAVIDTTLSTTAFVYDATFATGLTVVTAGGTPPDITILTY